MDEKIHWRTTGKIWFYDGKRTVEINMEKLIDLLIGFGVVDKIVNNEIEKELEKEKKE